MWPLETLLLILVVLLRIIFSLTVPELSPPSIIVLSQKLTEVVEYASRRQTSTRNTLRIISSSSGDKKENYSILTLFETTFLCFPIIRISRNQSVSILAPHTRKKHAVDRYDLFAFITITVIRSLVDISDYNERIRHSLDPRRDFLIFVAESRDDNVLRSLRTLPGLRFKTLIDSYDLDGILNSTLTPTSH
jgi:hypothetical protein